MIQQHSPISILLLVFLLVFGSPFSGKSDVRCNKFVEAPWRGIDCLHCLHPRAPGGPGPIVDVLHATCLKRVMLSFVVDGSFGYQPGLIEEAVQNLTLAGHQVWLQLYLYNGPAQRRWENPIFPSFASIEPSIFQAKLLHDQSFQNEFKKIAKDRIIPTARFAKSLGARVTVAPGLEDNLSELGFKRAILLLKSVTDRDIVDQYVRSSCFRCQSRNGALPPRGILQEEHDDLLFARRWNGIINTDGRYFRFSSEKGLLPTLHQLRESWLMIAKNRKNAFLLWIPHFQDAPFGTPSRSFEDRNLRGPTEDEKRELIEFLRS